MALQLIAAVLIISISVLHVFLSPRSSSWLHTEQKMDGSYKIGRIDFLLNGIEDHSIEIDIQSTAPTRFFNPVDRDNHFNMAAKVYEITGLNQGDIDVKVDLTYTDTNEANDSVFYLFVPADTTDENILTKNYKAYLDSKFNGYTLTTPAQCKAAMMAINTENLNQIKNVDILKDTSDTIAYLITWTEYDNVNYGTDDEYTSISYPLTIHANAHQEFYPE